jgi:putative DNA primase/helicase
MVNEHFAQAIEAAGLMPPDTIYADGRLHRFSSTGHRTDKAAWYVLHDDGVAAGAFGCWRTGLTETWCSKAVNHMTAIERETMVRLVKQAKTQNIQEAIVRTQKTQMAATGKWEAATPAGQHPYLRAKGVLGYNLRVEGDLLLVPLRDTSGTMHSLQTIAPDGSKRFMTGGRVRGCYHSMGRADVAIVICEGVATAHSVREATGLAVVAAFSAGNLAPVASALKLKFPEVPIVLAADDDHATEGNPGLTAARAAALAVGGLVVVPQFPPDRPRKATDFNDLFSLAGAGAVRACFAEVLEGLNHGL